MSDTKIVTFTRTISTTLTVNGITFATTWARAAEAVLAHRLLRLAALAPAPAPAPAPVPQAQRQVAQLEALVNALAL